MPLGKIYHLDVNKQNQLRGIDSVKVYSIVVPVATDSSSNVIQTTTVYDTVINDWPGKYDVEKIQFSGFIAQEVDSASQKIGYDFSGVDKQGPVMGLRYAQFTVPLVKAVQELSAKADSLQATVDSLAAAPKAARKAGENNDSLEQRIEQLEKMINQCCVSNTNQNENSTGDNFNNNENSNTIQVELANKNNVVLYQNEPNPFGNQTVIRYFIPETVLNSFVVFYDEFGKEVRRAEIAEKGFGKIEANTENLASGVYTYSIVVDGKVIDTKKMMRSK